MTKRAAKQSIGTLLPLLPALTLTFFAAGCSSVPHPRRAPQTLPPLQPIRLSPDRPGSRSDAIENLAARIVETARSLLATPYRYSGSDPAGFDCSGLTSYIYSSVGLELPRTTASQAVVGRWMAPDELLPGDLVFFGKKRSEPFHVGIVVSAHGEPLTMIHAATSSGVVETEILSDGYWLPRLHFGRRALEAD